MANDKPQPQQPKPPQATAQPPTVDNAIKRLSEFLRGHLKENETVADCVVRVVTEQGNALKMLAAERDRTAAGVAEASRNVEKLRAAMKSTEERLAQALAELAEAKRTPASGGRVRTRHEPA
jgi:hypothetical protein